MDDLLKNENVNSVISKIIKRKHTELSIGLYKNGITKIFNYCQTTNPYFDLGSISKVFTSLLILKLEQEKLINIDDGIDKYLKLKNGKYPTIKELLSHQTGYIYITPFQITILRLLKGYSKVNIYHDIDDVTVFKYLEKIKHKSNKYGYSDFSYAILKLVIKEVCQRDVKEIYEEFLKEEFEMLNTKVIDDGLTRKDCYLSYKKIDNWKWNKENPYISAGGFASTIDDMTLFMKKIIEEDSHYIDRCLEINDFNKHNLAFFLSKNKHVYYHVGGAGTFRSNIAINKKRKMGVVVLSSAKGCRKGNVSYLNKMIYNYLRRNKITIT